MARRPQGGKADAEARALDQLIDKERNSLRTDKIDLSYGELASMYERQELIIAPDYQRLYRWSEDQRAKFIESLLLGFPVPAIFVAETDNAVWELVDGLQRVSSVFEFLGVLKDNVGEAVSASRLSFASARLQKLPLLDGFSFDELSLRSRLTLKRAYCRVEVIKVGSVSQMKYDVFERLNTGGSGLEPQEIRNAVFRAIAPDFMDFCDVLAEHQSFIGNLFLSEAQRQQMFDRGLVLRFFTLKNNYEDFDHDVEPFITNYIKKVLNGEVNFDRNKEKVIFEETFDLLASALGEDAWRHFQGGRHKGGFSVYVFDALSIGCAQNIEVARQLGADLLRERCLAVKASPDFRASIGAGGNTRAKMRARIETAVRIIGSGT